MTKKALLTGTSANAALPDYHITRSQIGLIPVNKGFEKLLKINGWEVDWRKVEWGEDLSNYDLIIDNMMSPSNMTAGDCYPGSLWALRYPQTKVFIEDWQAAGVYDYGIKRKPNDSLRRASLDRFQAQFAGIPSDEMVIYEQTEADWLHGKDVMLPLFEGGNPAVVIPNHDSGNLYSINPNWFMELRLPNITPANKKRRQWVTAALSKANRDRIEHRTLSPTLPVWKLGKNIKGDDRAIRLHESKAVDLFSSCWFNLSVAYNHTKKGSGWWRMRYQQVTDGHSIVVCESEEEARILGPTFVNASKEWRKLEKASYFELVHLAEAQRCDFRIHRTSNYDLAMQRMEDWINGENSRRNGQRVSRQA